MLNMAIGPVLAGAVPHVGSLRSPAPPRSSGQELRSEWKTGSDSSAFCWEQDRSDSAILRVHISAIHSQMFRNRLIGLPQRREI